MSWYRRAQTSEEDDLLTDIVKEQLSILDWEKAVDLIMERATSLCKGAVLNIPLDTIRNDVALQVKTTSQQFPAVGSWQQVGGDYYVKSRGVKAACCAISGTPFGEMANVAGFSNSMQIAVLNNLLMDGFVRNKIEFDIVRRIVVDRAINNGASISDGNNAFKEAVNLVSISRKSS